MKLHMYHYLSKDYINSYTLYIYIYFKHLYYRFQ